MTVRQRLPAYPPNIEARMQLWFEAVRSELERLSAKVDFSDLLGGDVYKLTSSVTYADLVTVNIPANALLTNGDVVRVTVLGGFDTGGVNNSCRFWLGGTEITQLATGGGANPEKFKWVVTIRRSGLDAQQYVYDKTVSTSGTPYALTLGAGTRTHDDNNAIQIKVDGKVHDAAYVLTLYSVMVEYLDI